MAFDLIIVLAVVLGMLVLLAATRIAADAILAAALLTLLAIPVPTGSGWRLGVVSVSEGFSGFSNTGMLTVGVLFIVVAGLRETGGIDWISARLLGKPRSERGALIRLMSPVWAMSVFLNNTPVVALMIWRSVTVSRCCCGGMGACTGSCRTTCGLCRTKRRARVNLDFG